MWVKAGAIGSYRQLGFETRDEGIAACCRTTRRWGESSASWSKDASASRLLFKEDFGEKAEPPEV
ncbi:hypothetical protein [Paraburkholderia sp. BL27I4N3]|uniref:hypothetical protein n=1 Tax=Paraburkholderia sp. BL27I4N3 TaxID=1938805 RepID=UPI000E21DB68|nr:hypothetical protein [Paraburkholderia sp. BL27I4N3]